MASVLIEINGRKERIPSIRALKSKVLCNSFPAGESREVESHADGVLQSSARDLLRLLAEVCFINAEVIHLSLSLVHRVLNPYHTSSRDFQ